MRNHKIRYLPLALAVVASIACGFSITVGNPDSVEAFNVSAEDRWTSTGIEVSAGDRLTIKYLSGKWSPWPGGKYDAIGSGGDPRCRCNVMDGISHAALIGRIGENEPFFVGDQYSHVIGESGELFLGINDVDTNDNSGSLRVEVNID